MQNLVSLGTVYIYIYRQFYKNKEEKINLINKVRVGEKFYSKKHI